MGIEDPFSGVRCLFLENFNFGTLLAPIGVEDFRANYFEQKTLLVQRGDPDYYGDLFSVQDFDRVVASSPSYVKTADAKTKMLGMHPGETASGLEKTIGEMREGATLVLDSLHLHDAKLGLLCRILDHELGHRHQTNLYLTPPNGQGFTPHWDNHDVFILQVMGSKHWRLERQHRRMLPYHDEKIADDARDFVGEPHSFTLNQGDMVYIPRGYVHAAECGPEPSLHITLGLVPYTWAEFVQAALTAAIKKHDYFRAALPLGYVGADSTELMQGALTALRDMGDRSFLSTVLDQFSDEVVSKFPLDISGQITDFFRPRPLKLEDVVGPRRGAIYKVHQSESVRVNVGARSVTFPDFFKEPLEFALATPAYAIRDITGDLEDSERLVFIERLMLEGLVVRK
jgi:hypothetical protein